MDKDPKDLRGLIAALATKGCRVVAPKLPGTKRQDPSHLDQDVATMLALIDWLGWERPALYGPGLKDPVAERPNHSDLCTSEIRWSSVRIQKKFSNVFRNSESSKTKSSQNFLECSVSAKSREKINKIWPNFDEICEKDDFLEIIEQKFENVWWILGNILIWERCEGVWIL